MNDLLARVREEVAQTSRVSEESLREIEDALEANPSAELWLMRGDAIQLSDSKEWSLQDVETSYLRAIDLDPESPDAYEELGRFLWSVMDDPRRAAEYLREAIRLGAGESVEEALRDAEAEIG
jgi:Tfp pilus assembly protein PilF